MALHPSEATAPAPIASSSTRWYQMVCSCGVVWMTTRPYPRPDDFCGEVNKKGLKLSAMGCGRKLPAPVPA